MRTLARTLLCACVLLATGGCTPEFERAKWETILPGSTEPQRVIEPPRVPWPPKEPRNGSTSGSWTGVCDPKCPLNP